jgi:hypothetical protein
MLLGPNLDLSNLRRGFMPKKNVEVELEDSGYQVMQGLAKIVAAVKQAMKDGFQPGQDLPAIVVAAVAELPGVVQNAQAVPADLAEDKLLVIKGVNLGAYDVAKALAG